jgi:hypothetical protein
MKSFSNVVSTAAVVGCGLFLSMQTASATQISGTLQLEGTFTIGPDFLNFCPSPAPVSGCAAAPGEWNSPATGTGDLADYTGNGMLTNLSSGVEPVGTLLGAPVLFLTFTPGAAAGGGSNPTPVEIEFFITEVLAGVGTGSCASGGVGATCTPTGSAVTLTNLPGGNSSAQITAIGLAENLLTGEIDPLQIVLSAQFNTTFESVLNTENTAGSVTNVFSANFSATPVPEPSSLAMMGIGASLVFCAMLRRRKQAR